jgi:hypothetical protein
LLEKILIDAGIGILVELIASLVKEAEEHIVGRMQGSKKMGFVLSKTLKFLNDNPNIKERFDAVTPTILDVIEEQVKKLINK